MKRILVVLVLMSLPFVYLRAQSAAVSEISGLVQDVDGASVPDAQVQITNVDTNAVRTTTTGPSGVYRVTNLAVGSYKLEVTKAGFATYVQSGIVLEVNSSPEINVALKVGTVTEEVQVQADATMVETQSTGVGQVVTPEQVVDLPLNNRQANQLILLSGGAVSDNTGGSAGGLIVTLDYPTTVAISVAGSQGNASNYYLDGALNMDVRTDVGLPMPFPDALQEFKVETSAMPANYGKSPGGTIQATTMSGTNKIHGDLFEFLRNTAMDAKVDFTGLSDGLKRNQFGGVIGGPIKRDKLFLFAGYQETTERISGAPTTYYVPTAATLTGDFSAMLAPPCQATQVTLKPAFTVAGSNNQIQPALMATPSAQVAAKLATYLPKTTDPCGKVYVTPYTHDNEAQGVARVDWQRTPSDAMFARYFVANYNLLAYYQPGNILSAFYPGLQDQVQGIDLGDSYVINPKMTSSARVFFTRMAVVRTSANGLPTWQSLGSNVTSEVPNYLGNSSVANYFTTAIPSYPGWDYDNVYGVSEDIGWNAGKHQMNLGVVFTHNQMNADGLSNLDPAIGFSAGSASVTGNPLADLLTGNPNSFHQANGQLGRDGQNLPSLYVQDNWRLTRTLQLNVGMRWDPFFPQHTKYKSALDFSPAAYAAGTVSTVFTNAPPGLTFPGDKGFNGTSDTNGHLNSFAPRIGIVWDPRGKGRETIRAGYGYFYDTSIMWNAMVVVLDPPFGSSITFTPLTHANGGGLANPWFGQAVSNPFPTPLIEPSNYVFPVGGSYSALQQNIKPTDSQEWNLSIQEQVTRNWMFSVTYLGSKTTHQWTAVNLQPSVILGANNGFPGVNGTTGGCTLPYLGKMYTFAQCNGPATESASNTGTTVTNENARKALVLQNPNAGPYYAGGLTQDQSIGNGAYNGLLLVAQHRLSNYFSLLANYTWSRCFNQTEETENITATFQDPNNRKPEWAPCASDRRHLFNSSFVVQTPSFESRPARLIAGDWNVSGIYTVQAGSWMNVTDGSDVSLTGVGTDRPNKVGNPFQAETIAGNPACVGPSAVRTIAHWYNPCAYQAAPIGTLGNAKRNDLVGPGNWNLDAALWRTFPFRERYALIFRAEAFNVFNHFWTPNPTTTSLSSGANGVITTPAVGTNARLLQIAAKITF